MEINLVSRFRFNTADDAFFAYSMLSASSDTPYNIDDVNKKRVKIFKALEEIEFSHDAEMKGTCINCEWTFFDMDLVTDHLDAFGSIKRSASFHFISTDNEDPSCLVIIIDTKKRKHDEWNNILIDEWDVMELFAEVENASYHEVNEINLVIR